MKQLLLTALITSLPFATYTTHEKLIQKIQIRDNRVIIHANDELTKNYLQEAYFAQYTPDIDLASLHYSIVTIPFIMNIAPLVWHSGAMYTVPAMDEDLFHSLNTIRQIFRVFFPSNEWKGAIIPTRLIKNTVIQHEKTSTLTLFSGGLDALYSVMTHDEPQLLVTVQGGDISLTNKTMWHNIVQKNKKFAETHNHELTFVSSNFTSFLNHKKTSVLLPWATNWWGQTSQALSYCGLVAPIAFARGCTTVLLGATRTATYPFPYGTHPVIDNALNYAGITVHHDGGNATRVDKIVALQRICSKKNSACPEFRVCWGKDFQGGNCSQCEKCLRTIFELLIIEENPNKYGFNLSTDKILKKTSALLTDTKNKLAAGTCWHWLCIQEAYQEYRLNNKLNNLDPAIHSWFRWLFDQRIEMRIRNEDGHYTDAATEAFTTLWHKASDGSFTLDDLKIVPIYKGELV